MPRFQKYDIPGTAYKKARQNTRRKTLLRVAAIAGAAIFIAVTGVFYYIRERDSADEREAEIAQNSPNVPVYKPMDGIRPDDFFAEATDETLPEKFGYTYDVVLPDNTVQTFYNWPDPITFGLPESYTRTQGVIAFRGNNFRNSAAYGTANITQRTLESTWSADTGAIDRMSGVGYGSQPLLVKWPMDIQLKMNITEGKLEKDALVEVIYPAMDGSIYFFDMDDGVQTRDPIELKAPFRGSATLDPRGYPILYVGQGGDSVDGQSVPVKYYIINLINQAILYSFEENMDVAYRAWNAYDADTLICAEADTLIQPGENGIVYMSKLNTVYNAETGSVSVKPDPILRYRYRTPLLADTQMAGEGRRWWGVESSPAAYGRYLYMTDNGGYLHCIDMNTMQAVFVQDLKDDSDATMVLEQSEKDKTVYLYTGSEVDKQQGAIEQGYGTAYARKINARNGEIIWEKQFECDTVEGNNGGIASSPVLGKPGTDMQDMIIYSVARLTGDTTGVLIAFHKDTGEVIWTQSLAGYTWSSPVAVYDSEGKGYIVMGDNSGTLQFRDGATGNLHDSIQLTGNIEASPAVFNNTVVIGTRDQNIYGVKIK